MSKSADNGTIKCEKTPGGTRLFDTKSLLSLGRRQLRQSATICYCRVSNSKQKDDLVKQIAYMHSLFPEAEIVTDIGSGLNYKNKGLRAIFERILRGDKLTIVVGCRDTFTRFEFELIEYLVGLNGGKIMGSDQAESCPKAKLTANLLSIINIFSRPLQGLRKYGKKIQEDSSVPKP
ncbi:IS607 family transposase [Moorena sp. SIO3H5]|uniref:IS607 family transposase n=1 Tax=Moorena sp. SIO3H5 TaxID=2607834 RepID=UPI0025D63DD0|nr:IS607 family transposase [Moorena sp. SIO3H5]